MPGQQEQLAELLREAHRELNRFSKDTINHYNLTPPALYICRQVASQPGITVSEIARRIGIAKSHVSNLVRDLEQRGWVSKQPDSRDQRILRLYLNDIGQENLRQVRAEIRSQMDRLAADIPAEQAAALLKGLAGLNEALRRAREQQ